MNERFFQLGVASLLALFACSTSVSAATVLHDESVDGDLPAAFVGTPPIFDLKTGKNVVRGSVEFSNSLVPSPFGEDSFGFVVGAKLIQPGALGADIPVTVTTEAILLNNVSSGEVLFVVNDIQGNEVSRQLSSFGETAPLIFFDLPEDTFFITLLEIEDVQTIDPTNDIFGGVLNYEVHLTAPTPIPLPASLPLLAASLAGLVVARRRGRGGRSAQA